MATSVHQALSERHKDSTDEFLGATYHMELPLSVTYASPSFESMLGIARKSLIDNPNFWEERLFPTDLEKLSEGIRHCQNGNSFSMSHYVMNDRGLPVWIAHRLHGYRSEHENVIVGCLIPIHRDTENSALECAVIRKYLHKLGNHFQLLGLLLNSISQSPTIDKQLQSAQNTLDQAIELTRFLSEYSQTLDEASAVDLHSILLKVVNETKLQGGPITVDAEGMTSISFTPYVIGDPLTIETAFQILLDESQKLIGPTKPLKLFFTDLGNDPDLHRWISIMFTASNKTHHSVISPKGRYLITLNREDSDLTNIILADRGIEVLGGKLFLYDKTSEMGPAIEITIPVKDRKS